MREPSASIMPRGDLGELLKPCVFLDPIDSPPGNHMAGFGMHRTRASRR
jgi:hypothetical protein